MLEQLITEIRASALSGNWVLALHGTLALPDICSAIEHGEDRKNGLCYGDWVKKYLSRKYPDLDPQELWKMRCNMLHAGHTHMKTYKRVIFVAPGPARFLGAGEIDDALVLDIWEFTGEVTDGVRRWEKDVKNNPTVAANAQRLVRWHPDGLAPYVVGIPILT